MSNTIKPRFINRDHFYKINEEETSTKTKKSNHNDNTKQDLIRCAITQNHYAALRQDYDQHFETLKRFLITKEDESLLTKVPSSLGELVKIIDSKSSNILHKVDLISKIITDTGNTTDSHTEEKTEQTEQTEQALAAHETVSNINEIPLLPGYSDNKESWSFQFKNKLDTLYNTALHTKNIKNRLEQEYAEVHDLLTEKLEILSKNVDENEENINNHSEAEKGVTDKYKPGNTDNTPTIANVVETETMVGNNAQLGDTYNARQEMVVVTPKNTLKLKNMANQLIEKLEGRFNSISDRKQKMRDAELKMFKDNKNLFDNMKNNIIEKITIHVDDKTVPIPIIPDKFESTECIDTLINDMSKTIDTLIIKASDQIEDKKKTTADEVNDLRNEKSLLAENIVETGKEMENFLQYLKDFDKPISNTGNSSKQIGAGSVVLWEAEKIVKDVFKLKPIVKQTHNEISLNINALKQKLETSEKDIASKSAQVNSSHTSVLQLHVKTQNMIKEFLENTSFAATEDMDNVKLEYGALLSQSKHARMLNQNKLVNALRSKDIQSSLASQNPLPALPAIPSHYYSISVAESNFEIFKKHWIARLSQLEDYHFMQQVIDETSHTNYEKFMQEMDSVLTDLNDEKVLGAPQVTTRYDNMGSLYNNLRIINLSNSLKTILPANMELLKNFNTQKENIKKEFENLIKSHGTHISPTARASLSDTDIVKNVKGMTNIIAGIQTKSQQILADEQLLHDNIKNISTQLSMPEITNIDSAAIKTVVSRLEKQANTASVGIEALNYYTNEIKETKGNIFSRPIGNFTVVNKNVESIDNKHKQILEDLHMHVTNMISEVKAEKDTLESNKTSFENTKTQLVESLQSIKNKKQIVKLVQSDTSEKNDPIVAEILKIEGQLNDSMHEMAKKESKILNSKIELQSLYDQLPSKYGTESLHFSNADNLGEEHKLSKNSDLGNEYTLSNVLDLIKTHLKLDFDLPESNQAETLSIDKRIKCIQNFYQYAKTMSGQVTNVNVSAEYVEQYFDSNIKLYMYLISEFLYNQKNCHLQEPFLYRPSANSNFVNVINAS